MNIVIVIDIYDQLTNGTVMTAYRFVEEFKKRGHNVRVVATGAKGENEYEVPERILPIATKVAAKQQIRFGKPDEAILRKAFAGADIIHFYLPFKLEKKGRKIAEKMGIPYTAAFHLQPENITYNCGLKHSNIVPRWIYSFFRRKFYKHVDHIHCPSVFIADQLRKHRYKAKLHVISNGVAADFKPPEQRVCEKKEFFDILMIGRYATEKRQDVLIRAIARSKYADKIRLTLAGKGPKRKKLEKLAAKKLKNPVTFGFYSEAELIQVIHSSDLYVHAADIEIEAIACIEAFSCGLVPIIANSEKSATPQFALDERSLFKAGSSKDLAAKIDYWIEHEAERNESSANYASNGKRYRLDYSIERAEEMFEEAIKTHKNKKRTEGKEHRKMRRFFGRRSKIFGFFSSLFYFGIAVPLLFIYNKLVYGLKICGRKNLKALKKTGAISISNHVHPMDCTMNALAMFPRKVHFTSLKSNFKIPVAGSILHFVGVIPVADKVKEMPIFLNEVKRMVKKKRLLHVYAEGELCPYYAGLREFNRGAFMIAREAQVPVLPVVVSWRKRRGLFRLFLPTKPCATVTIGEPIFPDYMLFSREQELDLMERTVVAMQKIYAESNHGKSVDYWQGKKIPPRKELGKKEDRQSLRRERKQRRKDKRKNKDERSERPSDEPSIAAVNNDEIVVQTE